MRPRRRVLVLDDVDRGCLNLHLIWSIWPLSLCLEVFYMPLLTSGIDLGLFIRLTFVVIRP